MPSTGPAPAPELAADDAHHRAVVVDELGDLGALHVLVARGGHLQRRGQVGPELEAVHAALLVAVRHLLVQDAAARGHPLHVAGAQRAAVAQAVAVVDRAGEHVGDGLDAAVRVPGEARLVVGRPVVAEVVEQQERVVLAGVAEAEGAAQADAGAFHGRAGLDDALHRSDGHGHDPFVNTIPRHQISAGNAPFQASPRNGSATLCRPTAHSPPRAATLAAPIALWRNPRLWSTKLPAACASKSARAGSRRRPAHPRNRASWLIGGCRDENAARAAIGARIDEAAGEATCGRDGPSRAPGPRRRGRGARPELSEPAGPVRGAVHTRRDHRRAGATGRARSCHASLGQQVVVENQAGAGGNIGTAAGRQGGARWLHAADGHGRHARHQRQHLPACPTTRSRISRR